MSDTFKFISLFSGGGLADVGAKTAGFELVAANEINPDIADVYRVNHGDHIRVGNILDEDPNNYPDCDLLHASPVCKNASRANSNGEESSIDIATAEKTTEFIGALRPKCFTLENVSGYRKFKAFQKIINKLNSLGYFYDVSVLNSANFGVPQQRNRLFVRAVRGGLVPSLPDPVKWNGWYDSIRDIIGTFPETKFANWQLARLPEHAKNFIVNENRTSIKWIQETDAISADQPYATVVANKHNPRAFVVCGGASDIPRRAIVDGTTNNYGASVTYKADTEPVFTVTATATRRPARAWLETGKVIKITSRGLARFQTIPDWYQLPNDETLACEIIGNGVPCLMYQRIAESMATVL